MAAGAAQFCPPEFQVVGESPCADLAEAIRFGKVFDGDDGGHNMKKYILNTKVTKSTKVEEMGIKFPS